MDVVVIDFLDSWGMLLSRKWAEKLGGSIQMDLYCATNLANDGTFFTLYKQPIVRHQVEDPSVPLNDLD